MTSLIIYKPQSGKFERDFALRSPKLEKNGSNLALLRFVNSVFRVLEALPSKSTHGVLKIKDVTTSKMNDICEVEVFSF